MTRHRWIVFIFGTIIFLAGGIALLVHSPWSEFINVGAMVFGGLVNLRQTIDLLPSKDAKAQAPISNFHETRVTNHNQIFDYEPYEDIVRKIPKSQNRRPRNGLTQSISRGMSTPSFSRRLGKKTPWLGITLLLIALFVFGLLFLHVALPNPTLFAILPDNSISFTSGSASTSYLAVAWSPDGKHIAYAGSDEKVHIWDATEKRITYTYPGHKSSILALAWSHDGMSIASSDESGVIQVWTATNGHKIITYTGHKNAVTSLAWSIHDTRIASASLDTTVKVWDVIDGVTVYTYSGHHSAVYAIAWSHDGSRIVSASQDDKKAVQVWDATTGNNVVTYPFKAYTLAWSPDDSRIVSSNDNDVRVWDAATGGKTVSVVCEGHQDIVNGVGWSPDGKYIASGSKDKTVRRCDPATGTNVIIYKKHTDSVEALNWSPDSKRVASASDDGTVQVWDALSGSHLFTFH